MPIINLLDDEELTNYASSMFVANFEQNVLSFEKFIGVLVNSPIKESLIYSLLTI
jgi:hypothetical protein